MGRSGMIDLKISENIFFFSKVSTTVRVFVKKEYVCGVGFREKLIIRFLEGNCFLLYWIGLVVNEKNNAIKFFFKYFETLNYKNEICLNIFTQ